MAKTFVAALCIAITVSLKNLSYVWTIHQNVKNAPSITRLVTSAPLKHVGLTETGSNEDSEVD